MVSFWNYKLLAFTIWHPVFINSCCCMLLLDCINIKNYCLDHLLSNLKINAQIPLLDTYKCSVKYCCFCHCLCNYVKWIWNKNQ